MTYDSNLHYDDYIFYWYDSSHIFLLYTIQGFIFKYIVCVNHMRLVHSSAHIRLSDDSLDLILVFICLHNIWVCTVYTRKEIVLVLGKCMLSIRTDFRHESPHFY